MKSISSTDFSHVKALALDLDGTVLRPDNSLSANTLDTLRICREKGMRLIICTGRSPEGAEKYRAALKAAGTMVFFNGAEVTDFDEAGQPSNTVYSALLSLKATDFCLRLARRTDTYFQVYFPEHTSVPRLISERKGEEWETYYRHTGSAAVVADMDETFRRAADAGSKGCIKAMYVVEGDKLEHLRSALTEHFGSGANSAASIMKTYATLLEVAAPGVSKASGLGLALTRLGLSREEVIAFGDEESDIPLFSAAGFSAAPANAKESVKAAANFIIPSNAEDGVAYFLKSYLLH